MDAIKILGSLLSSGVLSKGSSGNLLGTLVGAALGGSKEQTTQGGGSLGDLLGSVLGGTRGGSSGGGIGDLLGSVLGGGTSSGGAGGLGDLLGSVLGGGSSRSSSDGEIMPESSSGGLGDLLGMGKSGGLGGLLGGALAKYGQVNNPAVPTPREDDHSMLPAGYDPGEASLHAELMIKAMISAAKSDGSFDETEQQKILSKLGDVTQDEIDFIRREFSAPLDVQGFANSVPRGMEHQVYAVSLAAINLDEESEAQYLGQLAQALRIPADEANQIHTQLGVPSIFA
jgi:uncharacterized membrane protein YebE (DUF533 family)